MGRAMHGKAGQTVQTTEKTLVTGWLVVKQAEVWRSE